MEEKKMSKTTRQLKLYYYFIKHELFSPRELMKLFGYGSHRTLQRDLEDLRDSGLIDMVYKRQPDNYVDTGRAALDISAPPRRLQHLKKLYRLGKIIETFVPTYYEGDIYFEWSEEIQRFEDEAFAYELYNENPDDYVKKYGETAEPPRLPELFNVKQAYYSLFPDSNERTRQRDFKELKAAGYTIEYVSRYREYVITDEMEPHEEFIMPD